MCGNLSSAEVNERMMHPTAPYFAASEAPLVRIGEVFPYAEPVLMIAGSKALLMNTIFPFT